MSDGGGVAMAEALNVNASVKRINLACKQPSLLVFCVPIRFRNSRAAVNKIGVVGGVALACALKSNPTLQEMNLSCQWRADCGFVRSFFLAG